MTTSAFDEDGRRDNLRLEAIDAQAQAARDNSLATGWNDPEAMLVGGGYSAASDFFTPAERSEMRQRMVKGRKKLLDFDDEGSVLVNLFVRSWQQQLQEIRLERSAAPAQLKQLLDEVKTTISFKKPLLPDPTENKQEFLRVFNDVFLLEQFASTLEDVAWNCSNLHD